MRQLTIVDMGQADLYSGEKVQGPAPFQYADIFLEDFMKILRSMGGLTSVKLCTRKGTEAKVTVPDPLWDWIHAVQPNDLLLSGMFYLSEAQLSRPVQSLDFLEVEDFGSMTKPIVEVRSAET